MGAPAGEQGRKDVSCNGEQLMSRKKMERQWLGALTRAGRRRPVPQTTTPAGLPVYLTPATAWPSCHGPLPIRAAASVRPSHMGNQAGRRAESMGESGRSPRSVTRATRPRKSWSPAAAAARAGGSRGPRWPQRVFWAVRSTATALCLQSLDLRETTSPRERALTHCTYPDTGQSVVGSVARNHLGQNFVAACKSIGFCQDVEEAELMGAPAGLTSLARIYRPPVTLELDRATAVKEMSNHVQHRSVYSAITADIMEKLRLFSSYQVRAIRREQNRLAHGLAAYARKDGDGEWIDDIPVQLRDLMLSECSPSKE